MDSRSAHDDIRYVFTAKTIPDARQIAFEAKKKSTYGFRRLNQAYILAQVRYGV